VRRAPRSIAGEFVTYQEVELHAKVAGYVKKINVDIGARVHKGQVLAVLEIPELDAQLQAASAGVRHPMRRLRHLAIRRNRVTHSDRHLHYHAQTRYNLGLSSIVKLSQAQPQQTQAQISKAKASYDYRLALAILNYQTTGI
jgi:multidrug efflux pump subunit AcrA (membrane-fusion protein)